MDVSCTGAKQPDNRVSTFGELLRRDGSFTVHERNIQTLGIELYRVAYGIAPEIMGLVFPTKPGVEYPWDNIFQTFNVRTTAWGTETLYHMGPKIWAIIPMEMKKLSFSDFKVQIRLWKPDKCPCRLCKFFLGGVGFVHVSQ